MSEPEATESVIIKEFDYDYLERSRRRRCQQTARNPLLEDRSQVVKANTSKSLLNKIQNKLAESNKTTLKISADFVDPLSRLMLRPAGVNKPAASAAATASTSSAPSNSSAAAKPKEDTEQAEPKKNDAEEPQQEVLLWETIRQDIVKTYDLNIRTLSGLVNNPFGSGAIPVEERKPKTTSSATGPNRFEYDKSALTAKTTNTIPMKTYVETLIDMHQKMRKKWADEDKVGTLQITIQAIKLFADNDQPRFAPYKYVYIMDILDSFSKFVFNRMKKLSFPQYSAEKLKTLTFFEITGANIPESAQEICRNWLRKVSSIRELVPRIYIEAALLPIYYFIDSSKIQQNLMKLSFQSRCIGDYINSVNYSTFMLRIGAELLPKEKSHILQMLDDFFYYMKQGSQFGQPGMSGDEYLKLFDPFLKTAFRFYSENCSEAEFNELFNLYENSNRHSEILQRILQSFSAELITKYASQIFLIISSYHADYKYKMYTSFLPKLSRGIQSTNANAPVEICNMVWEDLKQVTKLDVFLNILVSFIELLNKCFRGFLKTKIFQGILEKFNELFVSVEGSTNKNSEIFVKLEQFIRSILTTCDDIREILTIEPFLQFISFFPPQLKYDVSKEVLGLFMEREKGPKITDPISVYAILQIAKNLNESETKIDDYKPIFLLLKGFFDKVDFGKDLEQILNLFTEIRANFGHIPEIIEYVINKAIALTFTARNLITSAKMQKKINGFLQACIAFCYITIPMIQSQIAQFKFYYLIAQAALLHNLVSQAESAFRNAIQILTELPENINQRPADEQIISDLSSLVSFSIVLPDNPESENLEIYSGIVPLLDSFKWSAKRGNIYKLRFIKDLLAYLCVQKQDNFPYHIEGVKSNDKLFADADFKNDVVKQVGLLLYRIQQIIPGIVERVADLQDVRDLIRVICQLLDTLLMYLEPTNIVNSLISQLVIVLNKRCQQLQSGELAKALLDSVSILVASTLTNIEKKTKEIKDFDGQKEQIMVILNSISKKKLV